MARRCCLPASEDRSAMQPISSRGHKPRAKSYQQPAAPAKAEKAHALGFVDVIDLTKEGLADGVRRITAGAGADVVIDSIGGSLTGEALSAIGLGGALITLGYSAGRKTAIDVTDLIWKGSRMAGFSLFAQ